MPKQPKTMPYGSIERDLCALAAQRVAEATNSVMQIATSKEQMFLISLHAMIQAVGTCSGAFTAVYPGQEGDDHFDIAQIVLKLAREISSADQR